MALYIANTSHQKYEHDILIAEEGRKIELKIAPGKQICFDQEFDLSLSDEQSNSVIRQIQLAGAVEHSDSKESGNGIVYSNKPITANNLEVATHAVVASATERADRQQKAAKEAAEKAGVMATLEPSNTKPK